MTRNSSGGSKDWTVTFAFGSEQERVVLLKDLPRVENGALRPLFAPYVSSGAELDDGKGMIR